MHVSEGSSPSLVSISHGDAQDVACNHLDAEEMAYMITMTPGTLWMRARVSVMVSILFKSMSHFGHEQDGTFENPVITDQSDTQ